MQIQSHMLGRCLGRCFSLSCDQASYMSSTTVNNLKSSMDDNNDNITHTDIRKHIHARTHTDTHLILHAFCIIIIFSLQKICLISHTHTHTHTDTHARTHAHAHTHTQTKTNTSSLLRSVSLLSSLYKNMLNITHTHARAHTHTHTHTPHPYCVQYNYYLLSTKKYA